MDNFDYQRATSVADAISLLQEVPESRLLAGGQSLLPLLRHNRARCTRLVDIAQLAELAGIQERANELVVGAGVTHAGLAASTLVRAASPALAALAGAVGDPHVRHLGTIGGAVAWNGAGADYPAALLGLATTVTTTLRVIPADVFIRADSMDDAAVNTVLERGEVITSIEFPPTLAAAYEKFPIPASRSALVGVLVARFSDHVRVSVTGAAARAFRLPDFEAALLSRFDASALGGLEVDSSGLLNDLHGGADYRAHLIGVLARRAVARCSL